VTATQEQLQQQVAALDRDLAEVENDYAQLVEKLAQGDKSALRLADQLDVKRNALVRSKATTLAASAVLAKQLEAEQQEQQRQSDRRKLLEARTLADQIASAQTDLDRQLLLLSEGFAKRANLLRALASTGLCDGTFIHKALCKPAATRAACYARIHDHVALEVPASSSFTPLSSTNKILLAVGKDVVEESEQPSANGIVRRRLRNGGDT
jgi:hypothetical protein